MILDLRYLSQVGPGRVYYTPGNPGFAGSLSTFVDLAEGQSSEEFADEAAAELAANLNAAYGTDFEPAEHNPPSEPDPEPEPPPGPDPILQLYLDRAQAAPRVMARWAAGNDVRLATFAALVQAGEFPAEPDPADYETPEAYEAAQEQWLAGYDPDEHGWAPRLFAGFMQGVAPVVVVLNSLAFDATAAAVQGFQHPLATPAAKAAYLADMAAEGALA